MKKLQLYITIILMVTVTAFIMLATITAESKKAKEPATKSQTKVERQEEKHGTDSIKSGHAKEGEEGAAGEEEESAWRFPGWQTIFAVLAVGYYVTVSLNLLPKFAAKELEEHH